MKMFTSQNAWLGGFYELSLEFARQPAERLDLALRTLWQCPDLEGCYLRREVAPADQPRLPPSWSLLEQHGHLLGMARLADGNKVVCGTCSVAEDNGSPWLIFYVPMGALESTYSVSYPTWDAESKRWRDPLERWFASLGQAVYEKAEFLLGLIGFEVSHEYSAKEVAASGIPALRSSGFLWPENGMLKSYATNQWRVKTFAAS